MMVRWSAAAMEDIWTATFALDLTLGVLTIRFDGPSVVMPLVGDDAPLETMVVLLQTTATAAGSGCGVAAGASSVLEVVEETGMPGSGVWLLVAVR